jgi:hypothetical protein
MIRILSLLLFLVMQGCSLFWPYKSDFDCKLPKGEHCQSLYAINQKADGGEYSPKPKDEPLPCCCQERR